jgi:hypothetical protein
VREAQESARVTAKTNAVLKSTGGIANVTARDIDSLANALLRKTGVDDEAIRSGQNVLLTFTRVRNEVGAGNDVFDQATKAALDMSVALGTDLQSAVLQIGKALQDPVRGVTALRRAGVSLTKAQQDQINTLVKAGDLLSAQKLILRELRTEFEGQAEAVGRSSLNFNVFRETIRNIAADIVTSYAPAINDARDRLTAWVTDSRNQERVIKAVRDAIDTLVSIVKALIPIIKTTTDAFKAFAEVVGGAANAVKLLGTMFLALKFSSVITGLTNIGGAARTTTGQVNGLRGALGRLAGIGSIAIPILLLTDPATKPRRGGGPSAEDVKSFVGSGLRPPQDWARQNPELARMFPDMFPGLGPPSSRITDSSDRVRLAARAFGTQGGATAGRLPPKPLTARGLDALIPRGLQLQLAQARTEAEQRTAFLKELAVINKRLRGRLAFDDRLALENEKTSILSSLKSMNEAELRERQAGAKRVADAAKRAREKAAADAKKAREKMLRDVRASLRVEDLGVKGGPLTLAQVRASVAANEQAAQFRALGLTSTGDQRAPGARTLLRLSDQLIGRAEPGKLENRVKSIRKVITENFKGMSDDVRRTIRQMLDDIDLQLKDRAGPGQVGFKQGSPNTLAALLLPGGSVAERRRLAAGLSQIGAGGSVRTGRSAAFSGAGAGGGIVITGTVNIHGVQNVRELEDNLARRASQRARVRRGAS